MNDEEFEAFMKEADLKLKELDKMIEDHHARFPKTNKPKQEKKSYPLSLSPELKKRYDAMKKGRAHDCS
jgi:hypothetical protein